MFYTLASVKYLTDISRTGPSSTYAYHHDPLTAIPGGGNAGLNDPSSSGEFTGHHRNLRNIPIPVGMFMNMAHVPPRFFNKQQQRGGRGSAAGDMRMGKRSENVIGASGDGINRLVEYLPGVAPVKVALPGQVLVVYLSGVTPV